MKIFQVASNYYPERNGIAGVVGNISERLVKLGHDVTVITKKLPNRNRPNRINGVNILEFNIAGSLSSGLKGDIDAYRSVIKSNDFDILHIHQGNNWTIDAILDILAKKQEYKIIFTPHGLTSNVSNYDDEYINAYLEIFPNLRAITCQSESFDEKPFCIKHNISNIYVIPNGVDFELLNKLKFNMIPEDKLTGFNVINISNHNKFKGHEYFFKLSKLNPDINFKQVGENHIAGRSWNYIQLKGGCYYNCLFKSQFVSNLKLLVNVKREVALQNLVNSDLFVLTSNWEASPLVIIEAMAAGIPWLALNVGNLNDHKGGIVVNDFSQLNNELKRLKQDGELLSKLSKEGFEHAVRFHNWDNIVLQYQDLYVN